MFFISHISLQSTFLPVNLVFKITKKMTFLQFCTFNDYNDNDESHTRDQK